MTSPKTGTVLPVNTKITAITTKTLPTGVVRVQCAQGWVSVTAGDGTPLLTEIAAPSTVTAMAATGALDASLPVVEAAPTGQRQFVVCFHAGAVLRNGVQMTSPKTGTVLPVNTKITAITTKTLPTGVVRVQCTQGWVSVTAGDGTPLLTELA
jgi:hypothetical protein